MANELNSAIKTAAGKVAEYVDNLSKLTVETRYLDTSKQGLTLEKAEPVARTEIHMDGDCITTLPARNNAANALTVDNELFEIHQRNVQTAIEYRAKMMASLLNLLRQNPPQA